MSPDPERAAEAHGWLTKAAGDLRTAAHLPAADPPLIADAPFHAQQAVEKTLKAYLSWYDAPFRKTHDLAELGRQCVGIDATLEDVCRRAERLTVVAWIFRYAGDEAEPPASEARDALALARDLNEAILGRLPRETWP